MDKPRAFSVWAKGMPEHPSVVIARTASKARYSYWLDLKDCGYEIPLTDMRSRVSEYLIDPRDGEQFESMKQYRGIPFAKIGMRVIGEGHEGTITGCNSSCNLNVLTADGVTLNIHPTYDVQYFADDETLIAHVKDGKVYHPREPHAARGGK